MLLTPSFSFAANTTPAAFQTYLSTIPGLGAAGAVLVSGANGGPFNVHFTGVTGNTGTQLAVVSGPATVAQAFAYTPSTTAIQVQTYLASIPGLDAGNAVSVNGQVGGPFNINFGTQVAGGPLVVATGQAGITQSFFNSPGTTPANLQAYLASIPGLTGPGAVSVNGDTGGGFNVNFGTGITGGASLAATSGDNGVITTGGFYNSPTITAADFQAYLASFPGLTAAGAVNVNTYTGGSGGPYTVSYGTGVAGDPLLTVVGNAGASITPAPALALSATTTAAQLEAYLASLPGLTANGAVSVTGVNGGPFTISYTAPLTSGHLAQVGAGPALVALTAGINVTGEGLFLNGVGSTSNGAVYNVSGQDVWQANGTSDVITFGNSVSSPNNVVLAYNDVAAPVPLQFVAGSTTAADLVNFLESIASPALAPNSFTVTGGGKIFTINFLKGQNPALLTVVSGAAEIPDGNITLQTDAAVGVNLGSKLTVSSNVQDPNPIPTLLNLTPITVPAPSITKIGQGTLVFANADTYTGKTLINNGVLTIQNGDSLGGAGTPEQQTLTILAGNGTFQLAFRGNTSGPINVNSKTLLADIMNALNSLPSITGGPTGTAQAVGGYVTVTQGAVPFSNVYTITFHGDLATSVLPAIVPVIPASNPGLSVVTAIVHNGPEGTVVNTGATLQLQGGITVAHEFLTVNGSGYLNNGAVENVGGANVWQTSATALGTDIVGVPTVANDIISFSGFGKVTLAYNGVQAPAPNTSLTLTAATTAGQFQAYLQNIPGLNGNVTVTDQTGGFALTGGPFVITFNGVNPTQLAVVTTQDHISAISYPAASIATVTLAYNGAGAPSPNQSLLLTWATTPAQFQAYLQNIPGLAGNVTVTDITGGSTLTGGPFVLTFSGINPNLLTVVSPQNQITNSGPATDTVAFSAATETVTLAYNGAEAANPNQSLALTPSTTTNQFQSYLQNIPGLVGNVTVTDVNGASTLTGGPFRVTFQNGIDPTLLTVVSPLTAITYPLPTVVLGSNVNIAVDQDSLSINTSIQDGTPTSAGYRVNKSGVGTLIYQGTNTYTGLTTVTQGTLELDDTGNVQNPTHGAALAGNLSVAAGATAIWMAANQLPDSAAVTDNGTLDLNGQSDTIGPLTMTDGIVTTGASGSGALTLSSLNMTGGTINLATAGGTLVLAGDVTAISDAVGRANINGPGTVSLNGATRTFTVDTFHPLTAGTDLDINAVITGTGTEGIIKNGAGQLELDQINTYTGTTTINAGDLQVDGQIADVILNGPTAILSGTGTVGTIITATGGTIDPGDNALANPLGVLTSTPLNPGNTDTFTAATTLDFDLSFADGTLPAPAHDKLVVNGKLTLGGATLIGTVGNSIAAFSSFTVIQVTGSVRPSSPSPSFPMRWLSAGVN